MTIILETSLPDEILLEIYRYLSWFDVIIAFHNLNSRFNQTLSGYLKNVSIGNDCTLKHFQHGCSFLLDHQSTLFPLIRTLTISNRGSPLAAKYFLSNIRMQDMIYLEKLTLIRLTSDELLSYLDVIARNVQHRFEHLVTLHIYDLPHINYWPFRLCENWKEHKEHVSNTVNQVLMANNRRLQAIVIGGNDVFMATNLHVIRDPCIKLHTLSIMLTNGDELLSLFEIIPNIHCLHVTLESVPEFQSPSWLSIVLPYLVEFRLLAEWAIGWSVEELMVLLRLMPALQRLSLALFTDDARLLDGQQVRAAISIAKSLRLNDFNYAVEYAGRPRIEHGLISNILQTWLPQSIALTFNDTETQELLLHTIPCIFYRFRMRELSYQSSILQQKLVSYYGGGAYVSDYNVHMPCDLNDFCIFMQRSSHVKHMTLWLRDENLENDFGTEKEQIVPVPTHQQFHLTSLRIFGEYRTDVPIVQLLIIYGSYLRKLHIDFECLATIINHIGSDTQLITSIFHRNLIYLDINTVDDSDVNSGAFRRVVTTLFDNSNSIRHITLVLFWDFELFGSSDDMTLLMEILCSFNHCTPLLSIVFYHCLFSNKFNDNNEIISIEDRFYEWLNKNTHLTFEQNFDIECDANNKTLKLWLK